MDSVIATPKNVYEKVILKKFQERLPQIRWGENCDSVKQALTMAEEWLVGDIWNETLKQEFLEYIFKEGFTPHTVINARKRTTEWNFPAAPKNTFFMEIRNFYENYFEEARQFYNRKAIESIKEFTETEITVQGHDVSNSIYREALLRNISLYNQTILVTKNSERYDEKRAFLHFVFTPQENVLFLGKDDNFSEFLYWANDTFNRNLATKTKGFLNLLNRYMIYHSRKQTKIVTYMEKAYYDSFKNIMKTVGFQVSLLPRYPEKYYFSMGSREDEDIPIYIEVDKLEYKPVNVDDGDVTQLLKRICQLYNR